MRTPSSRPGEGHWVTQPLWMSDLEVDVQVHEAAPANQRVRRPFELVGEVVVDLEDVNLARRDAVDPEAA